MDNFEYGVSSEGLAALDSSYNKLLVDDIIVAVEDTKTQVVDDLKTIWVGVSERKFEADFTSYIEKLKNGINNEYLNLQERLKDIAYNIYSADEDVYQSPAVTQ